jgi:hypothetical protein
MTFRAFLLFYSIFFSTVSVAIPLLAIPTSSVRLFEISQMGTKIDSFYKTVPAYRPETERIFSDPDKRSELGFAIVPYFMNNARLWFHTYATHSSNSFILHDRDDLGIIYGAYDLSELYEQGLGLYLIADLQALIGECQ